MYSNNEIVKIVYEKYKINSLIRTMITNSYKDSSCDDLEQYIYEQLLKMKNERLNVIYESGKLRNFISQIIKRQRDGGLKKKYAERAYNTEYSKNFRINGKFQIDDMDGDTSSSKAALLVYDEPEYDYSYDVKMDFVQERLNEYISMWSMTGLTKQQELLALGAKMIVFYIDRGLRLEDLGNSFGVCRQTIYQKIVNIKKQIKTEYKRKYDEKWGKTIYDDIMVSDFGRVLIISKRIIYEGL